MSDDIKPTSADTVLAELTKRGYDRSAQFRFCRAARSWTKRDSVEWNVYLECEKRTAESP